MKLSANTIGVLTQFRQINSGIVIKAGRVLKTRPRDRSTPTAVAVVDDVFPSQLVIYNIANFLVLYGMFDDPDIEITDKKIIITDSKGRRSELAMGHIDHVPHPSYETGYALPSIDASFDVDSKTFKSMLKAASITESSQMSVVSEGGKLTLKTKDIRSPGKDTFSCAVECRTAPTSDFEIVFNVSDLIFPVQDYNVQLCTKGIARFKSNNIEYFITMNRSSKT